MVDNVIVVQHALVALVPLELSLRKLAIVLVIELIVILDLLLVLEVLDSSYLLRILLLGYLRLGGGLAEAVVFYSHVGLVEVSRRDIVVEV